MFRLTVNKSSIQVREREMLVSGAQNVYLCQFTFSDDWEGLDKTVTFQGYGEAVAAIPDENGQCQIPWEAVANPTYSLAVGIRGTDGDTVVLPTIYANLGRVEQGTADTQAGNPPPTDVYAQILAAANGAVETANSVQERADAGEFDGKDMTYDDMTPEQKAELVGDVTAAVLASLPVWNGGAY